MYSSYSQYSQYLGHQYCSYSKYSEYLFHQYSNTLSTPSILGVSSILGASVLSCTSLVSPLYFPYLPFFDLHLDVVFCNLAFSLWLLRCLVSFCCDSFCVVLNMMCISYVRMYADLTFHFSSEVHDLFQLYCVLSFVLFYSGVLFFPPAVIFHSRVIGACPATTYCIRAMTSCQNNNRRRPPPLPTTYGT